MGRRRAGGWTGGRAEDRWRVVTSLRKGMTMVRYTLVTKHDELDGLKVLQN